MDQRNAVSLFR